MNLSRKLFAEMLGTAMLLAVVIGSGVMAERLSSGNVGVALLPNTLATVGGLYVLIEVFGPVSGAHFNPVVSAVMAWRRELPAASLIAYVIVQLSGAVLGAWFAHAMFDMNLLQVTSEYQTINGVKLHYVNGGSGPLVYLVHGFGQSWYEWHQLMPRLAKHFTVVAPDLPGLGQSAVPPSYRATDVAPLLHGLADKISQGQKFDLVAHDIGIWNTYPMLVTHQDHIRRVVYMEAPIPDESIYQFPAFTPEGESLVWHFSFFAAEKHMAEQLVSGKERFFFEPFIKVHATNKSVFTPELLELYAKSYAKPHSLNAAFEYYRVLNQSVQDNKLLAKTRIAIPAMAIGGGRHGGMGHFQVDQMRRYADNVTGVVLPNCGHWLPEECADSLNKVVEAFLSAP